MSTISAYARTAWDTLLKSRESHLRTAHMHTEGAGIAAFVATVKYPHLPESVQGTLHPCPRSGGTCLPSKRCDAMPGLL